MSQAPTVPSSQVPNTSVEKTANDKDLDLDAISDLYRELTAALMAEHGYIEFVGWASVADIIDSIRHRNRLRDKIDWIQTREEAVDSIRLEIEGCLSMIRRLLTAMGM